MLFLAADFDADMSAGDAAFDAGFGGYLYVGEADGV